jgi:hypothetical protein
MREYIGNKVDYDMNQNLMINTQPVLVQSLSDELQVNKDNIVATPGVSGQVLTKGQVDIDPEQQYIFRKRVGKVICKSGRALTLSMQQEIWLGLWDILTKPT